ncbi:MAG: HDOD domain-containing protein [Deltaproteobacteria bacterium]
MSDFILQQGIDVDNLPTLPAIAIEAIRLMEGEHSSFKSVAELLENDQVLTSKVLHYANSAYIGARSKVRSISKAVSLLGFNTIRGIILSASIFDSFSKEFPHHKKLVNFWLHSIGVAAAAEILAKRLGFAQPDEAYVAGLLHDIGKLVCYLQFPDKFAELCAELDNEGNYSSAGSLPLDLEKAILGVTHIDAGKTVATVWKFPEILAKSIWLHHQPLSETIYPDPANLHQVIRFADVICICNNVGSSYFLTEGPYCHENFHYALENLAMLHHFSANDLEEILSEVLEKIQNLGDILGFWDEEVYKRSVSSANLSLGSMGINLDKSNRQLQQANRVLDATCRMARELHTGLSVSAAAKVICKYVQKAFQSSSCLCLIQDGYQQAFTGQISRGEICQEFTVPSHLAGMKDYAGKTDAGSIEREAVARLQHTTMELSMGGALENFITGILANSRFLATFFLADKNSRWSMNPILGELVISFNEAESLQEESLEELQKNFSAFGLTAGNIVERLLLEKHLVRQAEKLTETSRKMEENQRQLFHSHRLATVGQLAAGAAHEINNPLTIISLNLQILMRLLEDTENSASIKERLQTIAGQERRISKIIQDLMGFARPAEPKFEPSRISDIINKVLAVLGDRVKMTKIKMETGLPPELPLVMVDPLQMEQVFMNLLINANHAMPDGGKISIGATDRKNLLEISVSDTGTGIEPKDLTKIFDPFFTTKKEGEGTGLGLAICNSIVEHNGGSLRVRSKLGEGTTFILSLPVEKGSRLRALKASIDREKEDRKAAALQTKQRILVIDDERLLNDTVRESLRAAGYEADGAYDGVEGISLLGSKKYDLVLLDIRMPRKDGLEVLDFIREEYPDIKVIIVTGLASKKEIQDTVKKGAFACLKKPFLLEKVMETIKKALQSE